MESVEGKCAKCGEGELEGLKCTGGSPKKLIVQSGFFAGIKGGTLPAEAFVGVKGKYSVFKCFNDRHMCPEGDIGTCNVGRKGISCEECEKMMVPGDNGECKDCEGPLGVVQWQQNVIQQLMYVCHFQSSDVCYLCANICF